MAIYLLLSSASAAFAVYVLLGNVEFEERSREERREVMAQRIVALCNRGARFFEQATSLEGPLSCVSEELSRFARGKGLYFTAAGALLGALVAGLFAGLLGAFIAASWLGFIAGFVFFWAACVYWAFAKVRKRKSEIASQVPDGFRSLSAALASGRTLSQAIAYVGSSSQGLLSEEFRKASLKVCCGTSAADALTDLPQAIDAPGIGLMVMALQISAKTGAPLQSLFMRSAYLAEQRFGLERELRAKTAQVRLSARLVTTLPVVLVFLLVLLSPDYREGIATQAGTFCVAGAALLDIGALVIIWRLMKGVI